MEFYTVKQYKGFSLPHLSFNSFIVSAGLLAQIIPEKGDSYLVPIRTLLLFAAGMMAVHGSELIHYEGAGPLAVVFAAFTANYLWCKQGWSIEENPVSTSFEIFWMIFEPILFGVTGAAIKVSESIFAFATLLYVR